MSQRIQVCGKEIGVKGHLVRIAHLQAEKYEFVDDPEEYIRGLREVGTRIDLFSFLQRLPETSPRLSYPMELDNFAALEVSTFDNWWTKTIDGKTRNMVRKAEKKGITVREVPFDDALIHGIWQVYNECPVRQGAKFIHYGKDIPTVHKVTATFLDRSIFIAAFFQEQFIGFIKLTTDETNTQAAIMNIVSMMKHRDKSPTNALIAQAVRSCAERGIPYLVYSNFAYGKKQHDSLSDFKASNGFRKVDVPRYYVPLTRRGAMAFRAGLHRNLSYYLPESVTAKLRNARRSWYERKLRRWAEVS